MPDPSCTKCEVELRPHIVGCDILEMAADRPLALWTVDVWYCPCCGLEVNLKFAAQPMLHERDEDFDEKLRVLVDRRVARPLRYFLNSNERTAYSLSAPQRQTEGGG